MEEPLVGNREQNYKFFYVAGFSAIISFIILLVVTGYTAYISTHVNLLITDMTLVIEDFNVILPNIKESLLLLKTICKHENFTKSYGNVCNA
jgi:hypothetical protein